MAITKKQITNAGEDEEKMKTLCPVDGNVNSCRYYRKQYGGPSKN